MKDCQWFLKGFCCKDLDAGRCWDCTAPNKLMRVLEQFRIKNKWWASCKYPKLGKDK